MKAFVQFYRGQPINSNAFLSWTGFSQKGYEVIPFESGDEIAVTGPETIVHGGISEVLSALCSLGITVPPLTVPERLAWALGRSSGESTLGQLRKEVQEGRECFIKPHDRQKLFTGHAVRDFGGLIRTAGFPEETPVIVQEIIRFHSEWRVFVVNGEIRHIGHYNGDPLMFPDPYTVRSVISVPGIFPSAYSADFGITSTSTCLVELNDSFALGAYGMPALGYADMIETRWKELTNLPQ